MAGGLSSFFSAGKISRLPDDFAFPEMMFCTLITCWLCGNESTNTVPYKLLKATEITNKKERYKLLKMRTLMLGVQRAAEQEGVWQIYTQRDSCDVEKQ